MLSNMRLRVVVILLLSLLFLSAALNTAFNLIVLRQMIREPDALTLGLNLMVQGQTSIAVITVVAFFVSSVLIALTYLSFTKGVLSPLRQLSDHIAKIGSGDFTGHIENQGSKEFAAAFKLLHQAQSRLDDTFSELQQNVTHISDHAEIITTGNLNLSSRIEQQAAALQQTAASMEELSGTVRQNADNAHQANQLATTASTVAQRGGEVVGEVVNTMQEISDSSSRISDIVGVIDSIAFQTNILALNAAVEAARAGEQGRGFAVVASEVRALAQRSAQAAREITLLINSSGEKVKEGSGQVERAGATMHEIVDSVKRVTDIMGEISAATVEQSGGIDQINIAVGQLDATTLQNSEMVSQTAQVASELSQQALHLGTLLSDYHLKTNRANQMAAAKTLKTNRTATAPHRPHLDRLNTKQTSSEALIAARKKALKAKSVTGLRHSAQPPKMTDVPGMNILSNNGEKLPLLRPNLSNKRSSMATENEWVEF